MCAKVVSWSSGSSLNAKRFALRGFPGLPPDTNILMYIQPYLTSKWWAALEKRGIKTKNLDAIIANILDESSLKAPVNGTRMALLRVKRNGASHSNFLINLEEQFRLVAYEMMTGPAFSDQTDN